MAISGSVMTPTLCEHEEAMFVNVRWIDIEVRKCLAQKAHNDRIVRQAYRNQQLCAVAVTLVVSAAELRCSLRECLARLQIVEYICVVCRPTHN